jgi:hypothetical protein
MSPEAERVWKASDDYIILAREFLEPQDDRYREGNASWKSEEYRVSFLFPNWPRRSRLDLCKVRCRFLSVGDAQRIEREGGSQAAASGAEHQEADAIACQRDAQDACVGFTKIQREILQEKFFVQLEV